jgi:hypothetical protein
MRPTASAAAVLAVLASAFPCAEGELVLIRSIALPRVEGRIDHLIDELSARQANLSVTTGRQAVEEAVELLETRGIVVQDRGRFRVRDRNVLRYYARTIAHLLATPARTH